jgi:hypothetical protein
VLQTHREEKIARATSAAIIIQQKATQADPNNTDESPSSAGETDKGPKVETDAAIYENGNIYLKGNPLATTTEIRCSKCGLPRLLHPTDGNGARKPEPGVEYCKKRPFIDKPHHDIYGQTFQPEGPGRGKKKKDMVNPLKPKEGTPTGSQDSPAPSPPPGEGPPKPIPFPHAKCQHCGQFLPVRRMNGHMLKCIGGGGRNSSRDALKKIQNGNGNSSQNGYASGGSRHSTPAPSSQPNNKNRSSPSKRDPVDDFDSDSSPHKKQKKVVVKKTAAKKLKAPGMSKSASQHSASGLSFEQKPPASDEGEEDDYFNKEWDRKADLKSNKKNPIIKKIIKPVKKDEKNWVGKMKAEAKPGVPPPILPPDTIKVKVEVNGKGESREESESSQTLSSP